MKLGDLVKMDYEGFSDVDSWGIGIIVTVEPSNISNEDDVQVLWPMMGLGWEMSSMLEVISEQKS